MSQHIVKSFDEELQDLTRHIMKMGGLVMELIQLSRRSLEETNTNFIDQSKSLDKQVNMLDIDIEKKANAMLALRQPMGVDLRVIVSAIKLATVLERIGDIAKNTVKRAKRIEDPVAQEAMEHFNNVADIVVTMVKDVLNAFETADADKANEVWRRDDQVDDIYWELFQHLQKMMEQNSKAIASCTQILFAAKNFERMGDYATNMAKIVHFIVIGKRMQTTSQKDEALGSVHNG